MKARGVGGQKRRRERKSSRNGVHHANGVVWGPVRIERACFCFSSSISAAFAAAAFACTVAPDRGGGDGDASEPLPVPLLSPFEHLLLHLLERPGGFRRPVFDLTTVEGPREAMISGWS